MPEITPAIRKLAEAHWYGSVDDIALMAALRDAMEEHGFGKAAAEHFDMAGKHPCMPGSPCIVTAAILDDDLEQVDWENGRPLTPPEKARLSWWRGRNPSIYDQSTYDPPAPA
jgi:hypothetical protein